MHGQAFDKDVAGEAVKRSLRSFNIIAADMVILGSQRSKVGKQKLQVVHIPTNAFRIYIYTYFIFNIHLKTRYIYDIYTI